MTDFDADVRAALDSLPPRIAQALDNVVVVIEDEHLGIRTCSACTRAARRATLPDRITIYRLPLEEDFADPAELREEIRITVLHELAHYFGHRRGPARGARLRLSDGVLLGLAIAAGLVGAFVVAWYLFSPRR